VPAIYLLSLCIDPTAATANHETDPQTQNNNHLRQSPSVPDNNQTLRSPGRNLAEYII